MSPRDGALLVFRVGGERFALPVARVEEIIDTPDIRPLPEMRPPMLGVCGVRQRLVPVFSARATLSVPLTVPTEPPRLVLLRAAPRGIGLAVDEAEDVFTPEPGAVRAPPSSGEASPLVVGLVRRDGLLIAVLDTDVLVAACESATAGAAV